MKILLMRHAEAVSPSEWPDDDMSRPLSALGEAKVSSAALHWVRLNFSVSALLTSPFVRARQTADLIEQYLPSLRPIVCPELASGTSLSKMKTLVEKYKTSPSIWIVGHMPDVAILASRITGEAKMMDRSFHPGEILAFEADINGASWSGTTLWERKLEDWEKVKELSL